MEYSTILTGTEPIVITIGNFDGIHKGHQSLMREACNLAQTLDSRPVFLTFQPHTLAVVRPDIDLQCLTTLEERIALAGVYGGIQDSIVLTFTPEVANMSATEFLDDLRTHFRLRGLVVGTNFSLGHNRAGDVSFLQAYGKLHNIAVRAVQLEEVQGQRITSTLIRHLVSEGNVVEARELLGRPIQVNGIVAHGDQRGRELGFPTANIPPSKGLLLPANGVYAARVFVRKEPLRSDVIHTPCVYIHARISRNREPEHWDAFAGVVNIGIRPTFTGQTRMVEAHLLDKTGLDLYDRCMSIQFIARLRSEQRFNGVEALKAQIAEDVHHARQILQKEGEE